MMAGAFAALIILLAAPFAALTQASGAPGASTPWIPTSARVGQEYSIDLVDYLPSRLERAYDGLGDDIMAWANCDSGRFVVPGKDFPSWLTISQGDGKILVSGTPAEPGAYPIIIPFFVGQNVVYGAEWTINVQQLPHTISLISDPMPAEVSTSAGTIPMRDGAITVLSGTAIYEPDLTRDRYVVHRWTDERGNTYNWGSSVSSDLTLTAEWREHFRMSIINNTVALMISDDLPTEYTIHQVDWGDNTINSEMSHQYALPGDYTITVRSGQWSNFVRSSTVVTVQTVGEVPGHTVSFRVDGTIMSHQIVQHGATIIAPREPVRNGYEFTGWYVGGELYDLSAPITTDLTLTAGWQLNASGDGEDVVEHYTGHLVILLSIVALIALIITGITRRRDALILTIILAIASLMIWLIAHPEVFT